MRRTPFRRAPFAFAFASLAVIAIACGSSDETPPPSTADAAVPDVPCDVGKTLAEARCNPATNLVCNVVASSVTCCPPNAPFVCPANNTCYGSAAAAYVACGSLPHTCLACPPPYDAGPDAADAGADTSTTEDSGDDGSTEDATPGPDANDGSAPDASDAGADASDGASDDASDAAASDAADSGDGAG